MGLRIGGMYDSGVLAMCGPLAGVRHQPGTFGISTQLNFRNKKLSIPAGYHAGALSLPVKAGGIACRILGLGSFTAGMSAIAMLAASIAGEGALTAGGSIGRNLNCTINGAGTVTATMSAKGWITCSIKIGAQPSAFDIAQAILNAIGTQYNLAGTIGAAIQSGGGGTADINVDEIWSHATAVQVSEDIAEVKNKPTTPTAADRWRT